MPIKPIDLQTLFTQLDRIGREQNAGKEGAALQGAARQAAEQERAEESARSVKRTPESEDSAGKKIDADGSGGRPGPRREEEGGAEKPGGGRDEDEDEVIRDPDLGNRVDLSG
jgi:hypothetical protein